MKQCMDSDNLHRRLRKIIGQVQAIDRMIDEDVPCEDVLSQLNAAKSALNGCGKVVLEGHIKHCVRDGIEHGDADKTIDSFTKAVERFATSAPGGYQAILMDVMMPVMDGFEASRAIRALDRPDAATVPILAMTAQASDECAQSCHQVGMNGRLVKPLDAKKLAKSIREAVQNKQ